MIKSNIKGLTIGLTTLIILSAAYTVMGAPQIIGWGNSKTNTNVLDITVNLSENVFFNVTLNENVTQLSWFVDGSPAGSNSDIFNYQFNNAGNHTVEVNARNGSQVSNTIPWKITVLPNRPALISWSNNKTNSSSKFISINSSETVVFYATPDQIIDIWNWQVSGDLKSNAPDSFSYQFNANGNYTVNLNVTNGNGTSDPIVWEIQVIDITPPSNVTNLTVADTADTGQTYIKWTWQNPKDPDFNGNRILIDDSFKDNLPDSSKNYNATDLAPGTSHKITVIAFDTSGNNATPVENISTTLPNTLEGNNIAPVGLPSGVNISFFNVTTKGNTTISFAQTSQPVPDFKPLGNYVSINTSAIFTGPVTISLNYEAPPEGYIPDKVRLYYLNDTAWENVTTYLDAVNQIVTGEVTGQSPFLLVAGVYPPPRINITEQPGGSPNLEITVRDSLSFEVSVDQEANVTWMIDENISKGPSLIQAGDLSNFTFTRSPKGNYSLKVEANNTNGTSKETWNITVHPMFFFKGNRIWDGSKPDEFSLTYAWDPMSFSGFYYDINDDVGDESITINLDSYTDRTIDRNDLVYTTSSQEVSFGYSGFGSFEVIGFMAEKYFAGYSDNSRPPNPTTTIKSVSTLAQGQLHKVLVDDDIRRTVSLGSTLTLKEGYVLQAVDIDPGARTMLISLLKDGSEVDRTPVSAGQTYVYSKRTGSVSDLPLIMVRFDSVFSGTETSAVFLRGMFQISEGYDSVNTGNRFGIMEVRSVSTDRIELRNDDSISLSEGSTQDLMGDIKIIVADNNDVRFALSAEKAQSFEVRSSIYREDAPIEVWTPYNFGMNIGKTSIGFYYDLDEGIGNEELRLSEPLDGSRTITDGNLIYTSSPQEVNFGYSGFGKYEVIGFMADKYFAGYSSSSSPPDPTTTIESVSTLAQGQLHRVLIDDDTRRTISLGSTLTLEEGYVLKAVDIDPGARTMLISLLKDGNEIDTTAVSAGRTYVFTKRVGAVSDLPIILVRLDSVFSGRETSAAFIRGIFQISENYAAVNTGNSFGNMEVRSVSNDGIMMTNDGSISLDNGENEILMGNLRLKVGDTTDNTLRFYFAVDVTPEMVANLLVIDVPDQANAGEVIKINVTAGGNPVEDASIELDSDEIGRTDANGSFDYEIPRSLKGIHNLTATKLGYLKATKNIEILEYIERRLSIDTPSIANQFETITIKVTSNGTAISGVAVRYDNTTIGSTDSNGTLNYTLETSGTHSISASRSGYITVVKEIEVRAPYSEYKALDINITPVVVFTNEPVVIRSNITNTGTKKDILPVELIINGTAVDNRSVALAPGEIKEINFTRKEDKAGNYSVEILGQKGLLEVKQGFFTWSLILIVLLITGLGIIAIYLMTSKNRISIESLKQKLIFKKQ